MPWTIAHAAAVLPLRRWCPARLNFAALALGSMSPDFGYYTGAFGFATFAHTLSGSLVNIPAGLALLMLGLSVRRPVCFLLPQPHRDAFDAMRASPAPLGVRTLLVAALSVLLGAMTHIAWDACTHRTGAIVAHVTLLRGIAFRIGTAEFPVYSVLQQLSTLGGTAALVVAYRRWLRRCAPASRRPSRGDRWRHALWIAVSLLSLGIVLPFALEAAARESGLLALRVFAFRIAVYATAAFVALALLCALACHVVRRNRVPPSEKPVISEPRAPE